MDEGKIDILSKAKVKVTISSIVEVGGTKFSINGLVRKESVERDKERVSVNVLRFDILMVLDPWEFPQPSNHSLAVIGPKDNFYMAIVRFCGY